MTKYFLDQPIKTKIPNPKVNQIWERSDSKLFIIINIANEMAYIVDEEGTERYGVGFGWLDNESYKFIGTI